MKWLLIMMILVSCGISGGYSSFGKVIANKNIFNVKTGKLLSYAVDVELDKNNQLVRNVEVNEIYPIGTKIKIVCTTSSKILCNGYKI